MSSPYDIAYPGTYFDADVPDTLDLAERADLALHGMLGTIDPDVDFHPFFIINYTAKTPYMKHYSADPTIGPMFAEKLPMLRLMCGNMQDRDLEVRQKEAFLSEIRDDLYWNRYDPRKPWQYSYNPVFDGAIGAEDVANAAANGIMLKALLTWSQMDSSPRWSKTIKSIVRGLRRIAVYKDDYAYYPDGGYGEPCNYTSRGWLSTAEADGETEGGEGSITSYQAPQLDALMRWYAISGDEEALDLGTRLAKYVMKRKFWGGTADPKEHVPGDRRNPGIAYALPDAVGVAGCEMGHWFSHGHARLMTLRGILEYGLVTGDTRAIEFVRRGYEFTQTLGIPRLGWLNCFPSRANKMEACALGDLVALAVKLSEAGVGDHWDDIDALVRNMLAEAQLLDPERLRRISGAARRKEYDIGNIGGAMLSPDNTFERQISFDHVIQRTLGLFASIYTPESVPEPWIMQCCTSGAAEALFYAWDAIVRERAGTTTINLLLNRAARTLDLDSYLPFEGKVVIRNKEAERLSVRIPHWVDRRRIEITLCGRRREPLWIGNYLSIDGLKPGDSVTIVFPLEASFASYTVNSRTADERTYNCNFLGSTVVSMFPRDDRDTSYPLFNRAELKKRTAPMKRVKRFVAERKIERW